MKIIIPFTGNGSRFKQAGYERLKPFIEIKGKTMLEWIVSMFGKEDEKDIIFIARKEHLEQYSYIKEILNKIAPKANILTIEKFEKKGPVFDIMQVQDFIQNNEAIFISYCDYYMQFDWSQFKKNLKERDCEGAIPCYSGFHPNLIAKNNLYASCKVDKDENLIEIREKFSFEEDKTKARHSPGFYYFKTGELMKKYYQNIIDNNENINGEFYCSLPYNQMAKDGLNVWCPVNIHHFCQWGTPRDLEEFLMFNN